MDNWLGKKLLKERGVDSTKSSSSKINKYLNKRNIALFIIFVQLGFLLSYNPFFKVDYATGKSMCPTIKTNSYDFMISTNYIKFEMDDIVSYRTNKNIKDKYLEHRIVGRCNNNKWYIIRGDYTNSLEECVSPAQILYKRILGVSWGKC